MRWSSWGRTKRKDATSCRYSQECSPASVHSGFIRRGIWIEDEPGDVLRARRSTSAPQRYPSTAGALRRRLPVSLQLPQSPVDDHLGNRYKRWRHPSVDDHSRLTQENHGRGVVGLIRQIAPFVVEGDPTHDVGHGPEDIRPW